MFIRAEILSSSDPIEALRIKFGTRDTHCRHGPVSKEVKTMAANRISRGPFETCVPSSIRT